MSQVIYESETIDNLADAVRTATGSEEELTVEEMTEVLSNLSLSSGGGGYSEGLRFTLQETGEYAGTYFVSGLGTCTDTILRIPATYQNIIVSGIANGTFQYKNNITSVIMPDTITYIGNSAFAGASSLKTVVFSKNLKHIGNNAFESASKLSTIELPEGLQYIGNYAFEYAVNSIYIPKSVISLGIYILGYSYEEEISKIIYFGGNLKFYSSDYMRYPGYLCYWDCDKNPVIMGGDMYEEYVFLSSPGSYSINGCVSIRIYGPDDDSSSLEDAWYSYENIQEDSGAEPNVESFVLNMEENIISEIYDNEYMRIWPQYKVTLTNITNGTNTIMLEQIYDFQPRIKIIDGTHECSSVAVRTHVIKRRV